MLWRSCISVAIACPVAPVPRTSIVSRSGSQAKTLGVLGDRLVEHVEAVDRADLLAQLGERGDRLRQQRRPRRRRVAAGGVERGGEQRARAGRLDQGHRAVDDRARRGARKPRWRIADWVRLPPSLWTELRTTSAPQARALAGSRVGEGEVRAPGLVDDERHVVGVGDLGERGDVGDRAEVGGGDGEGGDRIRVLRQRASSSASGVRQWATPSSTSSSGATKDGRSPLRTSPSITEEWTLRCTIAASPRWARAMQIAWLPPEAPLTRNQLRRAPQASAASCWARWNGVASGSGPMSMPSRPGRQVEQQRLLAERPRSARVGAAAALVAGDVEAARVAAGAVEQRVEVRRLDAGPRRAPYRRRPFVVDAVPQLLGVTSTTAGGGRCAIYPARGSGVLLPGGRWSRRGSVSWSCAAGCVGAHPSAPSPGPPGRATAPCPCARRAGARFAAGRRRPRRPACGRGAPRA